MNKTIKTGFFALILASTVWAQMQVKNSINDTKMHITQQGHVGIGTTVTDSHVRIVGYNQSSYPFTSHFSNHYSSLYVTAPDFNLTSDAIHTAIEGIVFADDPAGTQTGRIGVHGAALYNNQLLSAGVLGSIDNKRSQMSGIVGAIYQSASPTGFQTFGGYFTNQNAGDNAYGIYVYYDGNDSSPDKIKSYFQGRVGIGTTNPHPDFRLDLNGSLRVSGTGGIYVVPTGGGLYCAGGNIIAENGHVGIGITNPGHKIQIGAGPTLGAYCDGGAWVNGSSRSIKKEIADLDEEQALQVLRKLQPVTFRYKAFDEDLQLGFIAEDVPELVATQKRDGVSPMDITAVLTRVVQKQQHMIETMRIENEQIKKRLERLENER